SFIMLMNHNKKMEYAIPFIIPPDAELTQIPPGKPVIPQPHVKPANHFRQVNYSAPVITSDNNKPTMPTITQIDNSIISSITIDGDVPPGNIINSPAAGSGNEQISSTPAAAVVDDKPLISAEVMPEFPGGVNALIKFILKNVH